MGEETVQRATGPKCVAIVGPFTSGKSTLFEAMLNRMGATHQQASPGDGHSVTDHSPEARAHQMSVELTVATGEFMDEELTLIDCPGSPEFTSESLPVLAAADLAIVVAEADDKKLTALQSTLKTLDAHDVPRIIFLNKLDQASIGARQTLRQLQTVSDTPLVLRQIPIWSDGQATGSIDLALERAYIYQKDGTSEITAIPNNDKAREIEARFSMLETLADHDDELMEKLLEDIDPDTEEIFTDLVNDLREGSVVPVFVGSAIRGNGILRLLKAIRHEAPDGNMTATRHNVGTGGALQIIKTIHTAHAGKQSIARLLGGTLRDGAEATGPDGNTIKLSGISTVFGAKLTKTTTATSGQTIALAKLDDVKTGDTLTLDGQSASPLWNRSPVQALHRTAVQANDRKDEVKLSTALNKLADEDICLAIEHVQETGQMVLDGQGEMHLRVTLERLKSRHNMTVATSTPQIAYRETIRKPFTHRARHKKQSGGHGQFGDAQLDLKPLARGAGFDFSDTISGGVVPKQYIPSVEHGVRDYLVRGPLGFPVVDIAVNLSDGSHHSVDSSDMAFQQAAKLVMREAMPQCNPVLLEPIMKVEVCTPSDATARVTALVSQRRGQILGYDARPGWSNWDVLEALMPAQALDGLIIELRSMTAGVASYTANFDHMAELTGRLADAVISEKT